MRNLSKKNTHQISTKKLSSTSSSLLAPCKRLPWKPRHVGPTPHWCWTNSPLVLDPWASKNMLTESSAPEEIAASAHSWMPEKELIFVERKRNETFKKLANFINKLSGPPHGRRSSTTHSRLILLGRLGESAPDLQVLLNVFTIIVIWLKDIERHVSKVPSVITFCFVVFGKVSMSTKNYVKEKKRKAPPLVAMSRMRKLARAVTHLVTGAHLKVATAGANPKVEASIFVCC